MPIATYGNAGSPNSLVANATGASYTIPATNYAFVTASTIAGGSFSINGTTAMTSVAPYVASVAVAVGGSGTSYSYTVPANTYFKGQYYHRAVPTGGSGTTVGGVNTSSTNPTFSGNAWGVLWAGPGQTITVYASGTTNTSGLSGVTQSVADGLNAGHYWLSAGTTITGASCRFAVALY